jgi:hypothetical protein
MQSSTWHHISCRSPSISNFFFFKKVDEQLQLVLSEWADHVAQMGEKRNAYIIGGKARRK